MCLAPNCKTTPWSRLSSAAASRQSAAVRTICVIGAGPSGLVAAKHLRDAGYTVWILERSTKVGGTFVHKAYDESRLVSSKYLTAFSDLRSLPTDDDHLSLPDYVKYLEQYCDEQRLWNLITFGREVANITRESGANGALLYKVETRAADAYPAGAADAAADAVTETMTFDAVCVCSGLHEVPYMPQIPGIEGFSGLTLHSSQYKDRELFRDKRVLVLGCGETGMDLAYRAVLVGERAAISIKRGFLSVPYEGWGGVPLDTLIANLFEHSYEHWWLHKHHLKWKATVRATRDSHRPSHRPRPDPSARAAMSQPSCAAVLQPCRSHAAAPPRVSFRTHLRRARHRHPTPMSLPPRLASPPADTRGPAPRRHQGYAIRIGFWLTTGSSVGWDQWVGRVDEVTRRHALRPAARCMPTSHPAGMRRSIPAAGTAGSCPSVGWSPRG